MDFMKFATLGVFCVFAGACGGNKVEFADSGDILSTIEDDGTNNSTNRKMVDQSNLKGRFTIAHNDSSQLVGKYILNGKMVRFGYFPVAGKDKSCFYLANEDGATFENNKERAVLNPGKCHENFREPSGSVKFTDYCDVWQTASEDLSKISFKPVSFESWLAVSLFFDGGAEVCR